MQALAITERITIADQPDVTDLASLPEQGYVGVINLRHDGEPDQPLSTAEEGERVRSLGLSYLHEGIGGRPIEPGSVDAVSGFLDTHSSGKVLVHCRKGGRAAALMLLREARRQGWTSQEALARGEALGLRVEGNLRTLVEQYLQTHHRPEPGA